MFITINQNEYTSGQGLKEKLAEAASKGFFYLEMPEEIKPLVEKTIEFANNFYKDPKYNQLDLDGVSKFNIRPKHQVESLYLERKYWKDHLPEDLQQVAKQMHQISKDLLKVVLTNCGIREEDEPRATGGVMDETGHIYFSFNHYSPAKPFDGMPGHKDFGQITVLFINKMGLQAKISGEWIDVPPKKDHFVINFGRALEYTINDTTQVTAALHRVQKVAEDRISFGIFTGNHHQSNMYQRGHDQTITDSGKMFGDYVQERFSEMY